MKALILALVFSLAAPLAMARQPKATQFGDAAKSAVVAIYARPGDTVSLDLVEMINDEETSTEVWNVSLSNGPSIGSVSYEVTVLVGDSLPSGNGAEISIRFLSGN